MYNRSSKFTSVTVALMVLCSQASYAAAEDSAGQYDQNCIHVGGFSAFSEIVGLGVKTMALSAAMLPGEMDIFMPDAERIAEREGVEIYREPELLVTDLFPAEVTAGKHVILIYQGSTLNEYLALKEEKAALVKAGIYSGKPREEIARKFGKLLSYPDAAINEKLASTNL